MVQGTDRISMTSLLWSTQSTLSSFLRNFLSYTGLGLVFGGVGFFSKMTFFSGMGDSDLVDEFSVGMVGVGDGSFLGDGLGDFAFSFTS